MFGGDEIAFSNVRDDGKAIFGVRCFGMIIYKLYNSFYLLLFLCSGDRQGSLCKGSEKCTFHCLGRRKMHRFWHAFSKSRCPRRSFCYVN